MQPPQPTVHIQLKRDGSVLVLGGEEARLRWFPLTLELLQSTLAGAKSEGAVVEYSRDDPHADPPRPVELIYKIIMSYHMPIKLLKDPPFPVP
jgi:hypothetical protein